MALNTKIVISFSFSKNDIRTLTYISNMIWEALQGETNKAKRKRDKRRPEEQQREAK